jgi:hypothetical protein
MLSFSRPGLRELIRLSPSRYACNKFWLLFIASFRIIWPYEFRDCYRRNVHNNIYDISPTFKNKLTDIRTWAANVDLFMQYPELRQVIQCVDSIPISLAGSPTAQLRFALMGSTTHAGVAKKKSRRPRSKSNNNNITNNHFMDMLPPRSMPSVTVQRRVTEVVEYFR